MLFRVNKDQGAGLTALGETFLLAGWHSNGRIRPGLIKNGFGSQKRFTDSLFLQEREKSWLEQITISFKSSQGQQAKDNHFRQEGEIIFRPKLLLLLYFWYPETFV